MGLNIHEHDLVLMIADNNFVECMTCSAVYCVLCGKRIATVCTRRDHGFGKRTISRSQQQRKSPILIQESLSN